jgi:peptidyl-prolyl cis-trans isomerase C
VYSRIASGKFGAGVAVIVIAVAMTPGVPIAHAETVMTISGKTMDSTVLDAYMEGRIQKPIEQVTTEERARFLDELVDIYVLSNSGAATELASKPAVAAQLELQRMGILARAVIAELASDIVVTEDEIQASYEQQIKLAPAVQFKARHILVESQGEAVAIIEELIDGGDFIELAKEHSTGPSGPSGGDLGWFGPDQMVKAFSDAVAGLADGRYTTDPVQTQFGWHVILREETRAAEPPPLEGVRENIIANEKSVKLRAKIDKMKAAAVKE